MSSVYLRFSSFPPIEFTSDQDRFLARIEYSVRLAIV